LQHRLREVVVRIDPAGIDHAVGRIDYRFTRVFCQIANRRDAAVGVDTQIRAGRARLRARKPGHDRRRVADEHQVSCFTSDSCQLPSASLERSAIERKSATPVTVMRMSAAKRRGMLIEKPAWRIW